MKNRLGPKHFAAALVIVFAATAVGAGGAQAPESVLVEGHSMSGVWKISLPSEVAITLFHEAKFGPLDDYLCRIEQVQNDLTVHCLVRGFRRDGTGSIEDAKLHLAWGVMMARFVIDAPLESSANFRGTFAVKLAGIEYDNPELSSGTKLTLSPNAPDATGKAGLLRRALDELATGTLALPHDEAAMKRNSRDTRLLTPAELGKLGAVEAMVYLGRTTTPDNGKLVDFFNVYDVEFANGERLCGIHQRDDGVIDDLVCA